MRSVDGARLTCPREDELLEALQAAASLESCPRDLVDHAAQCPACASLAAVALPLLDEHRLATATASVPSSGVVWWRAQMKARQEAAKAAARPITIVQAVGIACAVGLLAGGLTLLSPSVAPWFEWAGSLAWSMPVSIPNLHWRAVEWMAPANLAILLALTMVLVLAPVAIYLSQPE